METRYRDRNVDLSLLSRWIDRFFQKKGFRTTREDFGQGLTIVAFPTFSSEVVGKVLVDITGDPNDFSLKFQSGAQSEALMKFGRLTSLFGGGIAFLRGVKSEEAEERLEKDFRIYLEEKIDLLAGSAAKKHLVE